jgi:succinoglycan biosynthesis protein ExoM
MTTTTITVVIPTYNRCEMLGDALASLFLQETCGEFTFEIVVVDNASTDDTKTVVQEAAAISPVPLRHIYHEVPGDAPSRNRGIAESRGEWVAFFDDDELAAPDWLRKLRQAAQESGASVIGGGVQLDMPADVRRRFGPFVRRTSFRETDDSTGLRFYDGKAIPGCANALVARRVFDTVGCFDESMTHGGSDSDFFRRVKSAGEAMCYAPRAVIFHRISTNRLTPEYFRWDAHQGADIMACLDCKFRGHGAMTFFCLARIAHSLVVLLPGLAWSRIKKQDAETLDYQVRLWRSMGYARRTLTALVPRLFPQEHYFNYLIFRKGRTIGHKVVPSDSASNCESSQVTVSNGRGA